MSTPQKPNDSKIDVTASAEEIEIGSFQKAEAKPAAKLKAEAKPAAEPKAEAKPAAKPKAEVKPAAKLKAEAKPAAKPKAEVKPAAKPKAEVKPAAKPKAEAKPAAEPKAEAKPAAKPKAEAKPAAKPKAEAKPAAKPKAEAKPAAEPKAEAKPAAKPKAGNTTQKQTKNQALAQKIQNSSHVQQQLPPENRNKWLDKLKSLSLFTFLVTIPWLLVIYYVLAVAHPRYVSTSEVVVKQVGDSQVAAGSGFAALLGVNSTSVEDANYLTEFIMSNDMVTKLDKVFNFRKAYHIDGTDLIYELDEDATQEELFEYFKKRVNIRLDEKTHVLTLTTEGFNPGYALELNKAILAESEVFVNKISQHIASDQLRFAQAQVQEAGQALAAKKEELLKYQNDNKVFDPQTNAQIINQLVGSLQAQLSTLRTEERQLLSYLNPDAPQLVSIRSQIAAVQKQLQEEQAKLTSANTSKLNRQAVQFDSLKSEVEFAAELYKISLSSFEQARIEVFRKMKNLIVLSTPYKAQDAWYPRKVYIIGTSLALLLILYGFIRLVISVIRDHAN